MSRKLWTLSLMLLSGCGAGAKPELYALVIDYFTLPDTCYTSGMQPSTVATARPPILIQGQVWDGPEGLAYLEVVQGGAAVDLGAAPDVDFRGIFTGKKGDKGWTFNSDSSTKRTLPGNNVITDSSHASLTFERASTFKGTGSVSSSSTCVGAQCPGVNPSCAVSLNLGGTRLEVDYERAP